MPLSLRLLFHFYLAAELLGGRVVATLLWRPGRPLVLVPHGEGGLLLVAEQDGLEEKVDDADKVAESRGGGVVLGVEEQGEWLVAGAVEAACCRGGWCEDDLLLLDERGVVLAGGRAGRA